MFFVNYYSGQFHLLVGAIEEGPTPEVLMALGVEAEPLWAAVVGAGAEAEALNLTRGLTPRYIGFWMPW